MPPHVPPPTGEEAARPAPGVVDGTEQVGPLLPPGAQDTRHGAAGAYEGTEKLVPLPAGLPPPPRLDDFEVLAFLGRGSYGHVWKVQQRSTGKVLALKCFERGTAEGWRSLAREVGQLARLDGVRGVVDLKEVGRHHDSPWYVMALAEGGSLAARLEGRGRLDLAPSLRLFEQVAATLAHVHAKGILHCDLKPSNILLDVRGDALVADFGQAHLLDPGGSRIPTQSALGTLFYMAPEQASLEPQVPDTRWDVYALGAVFYRMLTGRLPRQDEAVERELKALADPGRRLRRYREWIASAPRPVDHWRLPGMDRELGLIVDRCLEVDPARRPHDAGAILTALQRRRHWLRQRPALLAGLVATLLALAITGAAGAWSKTIAVDAYREGLTNQQLVSNHQGARLVASAVEQGLNKRIDWVEGNALAPSLAAAARAGDRPELMRLLREALTALKQPIDLFAEATVASREGKLLAQLRIVADGPTRRLVPVDPSRYPHRQFSWRDWFSGQGDHPPGAHLPPIRGTHVSIPYVSSAPERPMFISISAPLREGGEVVGVLEAAVPLGQMNRWLKEANIGADGFAVLLDAGGHCVLHPDPRHVPNLEEGARTFLTRVEARRLFPDADGTIASYSDPVDGRSYLVGYAHMDERIGWLALVQHDRQRVVAPIEKLRDQLGWIGLLTFLGVTGLISGLWAWLFWMLRRAEQVGEG